jgi:hypothetical protein
MSIAVTEWIFTFGFGHVHPVSGESLARRYVRITARDAEAAREEMHRRWGNRWAFQYATEEAAGVARWGLRELETTP